MQKTADDYFPGPFFSFHERKVQTLPFDEFFFVMLHTMMKSCTRETLHALPGKKFFPLSGHRYQK